MNCPIYQNLLQCNFIYILKLTSCYSYKIKIPFLIQAKKTTPLLDFLKNKQVNNYGGTIAWCCSKRCEFTGLCCDCFNAVQRIREEKREERRRRELERKRLRDEERRKWREEDRRKRKEAEKMKRLDRPLEKDLDQAKDEPKIKVCV